MANYANNSITIFPDGSVTGAVTLTSGVVQPLAVIVADFRGASSGPDIAVLNSNGTIQFFLNPNAGAGNFQFTPGPSINVAGDAVAMATGAFFANTDIGDLVVVGSTGNVEVLQNTSSATAISFGTAVPVLASLPGTAIGVAVGDLSGGTTGLSDIAVLYQNATNSSSPVNESMVAVLLNTGLTGGIPVFSRLSPPSSSTRPNPLDYDAGTTSPTAIAVADVSGGTIEDIIVASDEGRGYVSVLKAAPLPSSPSTTFNQIPVSNLNSVSGLDNLTVTVDLVDSEAVSDISLTLVAPDGIKPSPWSRASSTSSAARPTRPWAWPPAMRSGCTVLPRARPALSGRTSGRSSTTTPPGTSSTPDGRPGDEWEQRGATATSATSGRKTVAWRVSSRPSEATSTATGYLLVTNYSSAGGGCDPGRQPPVQHGIDRRARPSSSPRRSSPARSVMASPRRPCHAQRGRPGPGSGHGQHAGARATRIRADLRRVRRLLSTSRTRTGTYNPTTNTDIYLVSDVIDQRRHDLDRHRASVNDDDSDTDGYSSSTSDNPISNYTTGRTQFQPEIAVDQATGTLVISWRDARDDAANARVATYITTSIDGGNTFSAQTYANPAQTATDAITGQTDVIGPESDNQSTGDPLTDTTFGYGDQMGLAVFDGQVYPRLGRQPQSELLITARPSSPIR